MKKIRTYLRNGFSLITILVYIFVMLFQNMPFVNIIDSVQAEEVANKDNLVLILVDSKIFSQIKNDINFYTQYIQKRNKNTKAIVFPIDTNYIKAYDIQNVIQNLYFNGEKEKTSFLKSIVLIGNVPLPVVERKGYVFPSIYPYVDVKFPSFVYDKKGGYFKYTGKSSDIELTHGIIKFSNIGDYHKYFAKLKNYEQHPSNFVDKKFYYENFIGLGDGFNKDLQKLYLNKLIFAENLISGKITPLILEIFDSQNKKGFDDLLANLKEQNSNTKFDTFKAPSRITKGGFLTNKLGFNKINNLTDTEKKYKASLSKYADKISNMVKSIKAQKNPYWLTTTLTLESTVKNFIRNYAEIFSTDYISSIDKNLEVTGRYSWDNTASSINVIDKKDELAISYIYKINKDLEKNIYQLTNNWYKKYPIMDYYEKNSISMCGDGEVGTDRYEAFWFGKNAHDIKNLSDIHIYRGTWGNYKGVDSLEKVKSRGTTSSVSMLNNLFDIQTISNRGYNTVDNAKNDGDLYKSTNGGKNMKTWAKAIFGGYTPLNMNISAGNYDPYNIHFNYENYKYAWHPSVTLNKNGSLLDYGGTTLNKNKQSTIYTDTIAGIKKYDSVRRTVTQKGTTFCEKIDYGDNKVAGNYKLENKVYIDTRIQHISPSKEEFAGMNLGTQLRPVDSRNYVAFLGKNDKNIYLDYPDIFKVNVYKKLGNKYVLKTQDEIYDAVVNYLKNVVKDYNKKLAGIDSLNENYFVNLLGKKKIAEISEMLYYINLGWKEKPADFANLKQELDYLYKNFDINEKIAYVTQNFVNTEDKKEIKGVDLSHSNLNFLSKANNGYEAGLIISKRTDDINTNINFQPSYFDLSSYLNQDNLPVNVNPSNNQECGRPLGEGVILWEWPAAFMCRLKETLKKPFKIKYFTCAVGNNSSADYGKQEEDADTENEQLEQMYEKEGQDTYEKYLKIKEYVNNAISIKTDKLSYLHDDLTGSFFIQDYYNTKNIVSPISFVNIKSPKKEGNCLYIKVNNEYKNTCEGVTIPFDKWKLDFAFYNPKTNEGKYFAYKAGEKIINWTFCDDDDVCYVKEVVFDKLPGNVKKIDIKPFSDVMVYGGENPVVFQAYDAKVGEGKYPNLVNYTPYYYNLFLDPPVGGFKTQLGKKISTNISYNFDSSKSLLLLKTNINANSPVNNFNIVLKLDKNWEKLLENKNVIKEVKRNIKIVKKTKLNSSEVIVTPKNYILPQKPDDLLDQDVLKNYGIKQYSKNKLIKIHIQPKVAGQVLKTPVEIETSKYFIVGKFVKSPISIGKNGKRTDVLYDKFVKQNRFLIKDDNGIDVYLLPTFKTGKYTIKVKIPGINDYVINGTFADFPTDKVYIKLDKYIAKKGETVKGTIFAIDKYGNLQDINSSKIKITHGDGIVVKLNGDKLEIRGKKSGFIQVEYNGKIYTTGFSVENTFIPLDKKISVMYLTLIGSDWGKYANKIMANSEKNLVITTTIKDPKLMKSYDYIIGENLKNTGNFISQLLLKGNKLIINLGSFDVIYDGKIFSNVRKILKIDSILLNGIYYIPEPTDDFIKINKLENNKLIVNDTTLIDFTHQLAKSTISIIYNKILSDKYNFGVYNIYFSGRKIGTLVFNGKIVDSNNLVVSKPFITETIYGEGTTNGIKALGITINSRGTYKSIDKNFNLDIEKDKGLFFRGKFRNITDFAAGLNVGQATKSFENELIVNYGDPFVRRISLEKVLDKVKVSKTYGKRIFSAVHGGIKKVISLDFNNDGLKDILILYRNKIRLLKNYKGYNHFEDLGNLIILGKDVAKLYEGDVDGDGYKDLFVLFVDGTMRVYKNNNGEFDVNGTPICLPLPKTDGYHLDYEQIFIRDMNNNQKTDIVVNDRESNIKIYFDGSYLSTDKRTCDAHYKDRIKEKLVKSYGMTVDKNKKFADAGYIYRQGMKNDSTLYRKQLEQAFKNKNLSSLPSGEVTPKDYLQKVSQNGTEKFAFQAIPKPLTPSYINFSGDYLEFKKVPFLTTKDDITVYKTMEDENEGTLLPGDKVKITVHILNPSRKKLTYLEELKGPFAVISKNDVVQINSNGIDEKYISTPGKAYSEFLFRVDGTNSSSFTITYEAIFLGQSTVKIKVGDWDKNKYGDIKVFLKNGCIKGYDYFKGKSGSPYMSFDYSYVDLAKKLKDFTNNAKGTNKVGDIINDVKNGNTDKLLDKYVKGQKEDIFSVDTDNLSATVTINSPAITKMKAKLDKLMKSLCRGYSFGKSSCSGSPIPCNYAFLAPGIKNACGCPIGIDYGRPVFWWPGTRYTSSGPVPVVNGKLIPTPGDPLGPKSGVFPSNIRIYVAPTLSMGVGVAACFGSYSAGMTSPTAPVGAIAGNCVVVAGELSAKCKNKNGDNELDNWMLDLQNGICSSLPVTVGRFPVTSIDANGLDGFKNSPFNSDISAGISVAGKTLIKFDATAHKINSLADAKVLLQGGTPLNLHIRTGTFKGIISCVIKKWLNHQIQFTISQLTHMTIYVAYPDFSGLMKGLNPKNWKNFNNNGDSSDKGNKDTNKDTDKISQDKKDDLNIISKYLPSKEGLRDVNKSLSNPFKAIGAYFQNVPLVNVSYKTVVVKVPWIGKDELERQISYLQAWKKQNEDALKSWENLPNKLKNKDYSKVLKIKKFINSVNRNIEVLKQYRNFPLKLYKYLHAFDFYLNQVLCIVKRYMRMIVGWMRIQSIIFEKWVDTIIMLINIFKTWQLLIDVSVDWKSSCGKCRQDTGDLYDCTLTGLCPSLPVLPIPPFKIPDIFIDFTHINMGIDIVLPRIKIYPVPIGVFTLPNLPYAGDVNVSLELPALPTLPSPPKLPPLPNLPKMPYLDLPNLPPPPKIPELMPSLQVALKVFKIVGYFRCIIKNGIGLVAEWNVKTRIEQLTARHNRISPFDFINIDFPILPFTGYDVRVDGYINFRVKLDQLYKLVKKLADKINKKTKPMINHMIDFNLKFNEKSAEIDEKLNKYDLHYYKKFTPGKDKMHHLQQKFDNIERSWQQKVDNFGEKLYNFNPKLNTNSEFVINKKPIEVDLARKLLVKELKVFIGEKNQAYLLKLPKKYFDVAKNILSDTNYKPKTKANIDGINKIENQITKLVNAVQLRNDKIKQAIEKMEKGQKVDFDDDIFVKSPSLVGSDYDGKITYKAPLFKTDKRTLSIIENSKAPEQYYAYMYKRLATKIDQKAKQYAYKDPRYYKVQYKAEKSLQILNGKNNQKLAYAPNSSNNPIIADPSQSIRGLYMEKDDIYYNVMADKDLARKISRKKTYFLDDINKDGKYDLIWYDKNFVYIKYSNDEPKDDGTVITKSYIYNSIVKNFKAIADKDGYVLINGEKFKITDKKRPIDTLRSSGTSFNSVKLNWKKKENVNAYVLLYTSRIDILNEIEKTYNYSPDFNYHGKTFRTYALVLYDKKLGKVSNIEAGNILINGRPIMDVKYLPISFEDKKSFYAVLNKENSFIKDKWKYFRVYNANLDLNSKKLDILSSYSNQDVGAEQMIGDDEGPLLKINLIRLKTNKVVGTGYNLLGYVNTSYKIKGTWTDDIGVKSKFITDKMGNILTEGDEIKINPQQEKGKKIYYFIAEDYNGNYSSQMVVLNINVPNISIVDIDTKEGKISSKITKDMDETAVKFAVVNGNRIQIIKSIQGKDIFTGSVGKITFTGAIFDNQKEIALYNKQQKQIGTFNLKTEIIKVDIPYYILGTILQNTLFYNVYDPSGLKLFSIYVVPKELLKEPQMYNTSKYSLNKIQNLNMGAYNGGYCLMDKTVPMCAILISKQGKIYVDSNYENDFVVKYSPDSLGNVTAIFYDVSAPNPVLLTDDKKIFSIIYSTKDLTNK